MKEFNFIFAKNRLLMKMSDIKKVSVVALSLLILGSCAQDESTSTGWKFNKTENGGFEKKDVGEQETGPGLVMIEGGTFTMGRTEEDVMDDWNARASKKTVSSFYMDRTEVSNFHWLEYVYWMKRVYYKSYPHIYKKSLPDTLAWRSPLSYQEKCVDYYLRDPRYRDYPVVGVSWIQANDFCKWRTDRVNEAILVREGIINWHFADKEELGVALLEGSKTAPKKGGYKDGYNSIPENMFNTESYLSGQYYKTTPTGYTVSTKEKPKGPGGNKNSFKPDQPRDPYMLDNYDPIYAIKEEDGDNFYRGKRQVRIEDGILLPKYRLPTEAEWEFAASGLIGNLDPNSENIDEQRIYPWDGHYVRKDEEQFQGSIQANFVRGKGDYMGVSGALNDAADITCRVDEYWPNDYGLYNMAGNVSEWVMDTYRPLSSEVTDEFMPFRGNNYQTKLLVPDGLYDKQVKATENIYDVYGMKEFVNEYARVKYLSMTNNALDISKKFQDNYKNQDKISVGLEFEANKDSLVLILGDIVTLTANDKIDDKTIPLNWDIKDATLVGNTKKSDKIVKVKFNKVGSFNVKLTQGTLVGEKINYITVVKSAAELRKYVNTKSSETKINSNQDKVKYQFNSPSNSYLANSSRYTLNDSIQFAVLDDINALLDTAIYLYNKGNTIKASAYIEQVLFGNVNTSVGPIDFRKGYVEGPDAPEGLAIGVPLLVKDKEDPTVIKPQYFSIFKDDYLELRFNDYKTDPTISSWLITLRNGCSEFIVESRGKQRWRNVTEEENVGRLNYRKDDYIDYLDGDLESSIFYNNKIRKDEINSGKRDASQVVYQNEHENFDLEGKAINEGRNGYPTTLISDKSKVYKGGSWSDRAYWLAASNRRFLDEDKSSAFIGFRCAMDRVGDVRQNTNRKKRK
jgi:gliding motility-associated lipoprotein GldJ